MYPAYKGKRENNQDEEIKRVNELAYPQFTTLRKEVLPEIGFQNIFHEIGYEADDLMWKIVNDHPDNYVIVSRDNDLFQLLDRCDMYDPELKKLFTRSDLEAKYGVKPDQWAMVKAVAGCKSDNVRGVSGVGEPTACKYVNGKLSPKSKAYRDIMTNEELIRQNELLVKLPLEGTPDVVLKEEVLSLRGFLSVCNTWDLYSFAIRRLEEWGTILNLK